MFNLNLYFSTKGRIGRQTWWMSTIIVNAILFSLYIIMFLFGNIEIQNSSDVSGILQALFAIIFQLVIYTAYIIVSVKRLHDIGKSGWYYLIALIPFVGGLILFIQLGFEKGTSGLNQYGQDPLQLAD